MCQPCPREQINLSRGRFNAGGLGTQARSAPPQPSSNLLTDGAKEPNTLPPSKNRKLTHGSDSDNDDDDFVCPAPPRKFTNVSSLAAPVPAQNRSLCAHSTDVQPTAMQPCESRNSSRTLTIPQAKPSAAPGHDRPAKRMAPATETCAPLPLRPQAKRAAGGDPMKPGDFVSYLTWLHLHLCCLHAPLLMQYPQQLCLAAPRRMASRLPMKQTVSFNGLPAPTARGPRQYLMAFHHCHCLPHFLTSGWRISLRRPRSPGSHSASVFRAANSWLTTSPKLPSRPASSISS